MELVSEFDVAKGISCITGLKQDLRFDEREGVYVAKGISCITGLKHKFEETYLD